MLTLKEFLASEVVPALGCTEPGAVALAVARVREEIPGELQQLSVVVSRSIHKNGMAVGVPGSDGLKGNDVAAALGWLYGKSAYGLEVLKDAPPNASKAAAQALLASGKLSLCPDMEQPGVFISAKAVTDQGEAVAVIEGRHENIVRVLRNGKLVYSKDTIDNHADTATNMTPPVSEQITTLSFAQTVAIAESMTDEDVDALMSGVTMNHAMARYGLEHQVGLGVGKAIAEQCQHDDIAQKIKAWTAAAADARMSGVMMPVMSSAGSGNHGVTAVIPVAVYAEYLGKSRRETAYAVALSHLVTSFVKSRTGRLTPICGCSVAAGAGAAAAIAWLRSADMHRAAIAVNLMMGNLSGMICDGAKASCALKVGSGAIEAYYSAVIASANDGVDRQGLIGMTVEQSVRDLARVSTLGMEHMDDVLCKIISE